MSKNKLTYKKFNRSSVNAELSKEVQEGYDYHQQNDYYLHHDDEMIPFYVARWHSTTQIHSMDDYWKFKVLTLLRSLGMSEIDKIAIFYGAYWLV